MRNHLRANLWLLVLTMLLVSVLYPALLLGVGQIPGFRDQAEGSLLIDASGKVQGSRLIAQPFKGAEYFQPRPSAVDYKADASGGSNLAANNYALRDRVARQLGPIVRYGKGAEKFGKMPGELVGPDIDQWFQKDRHQGKPGIVAQWAVLHPSLAEAWIKSTGDALKAQWKQVDAEKDAGANFLAQWQEDEPALVAAWKEKNPNADAPKPADLAAPFFESFSTAHPGAWPYVDDVETKDKQKRKKITRIKESTNDQTEIRSVFFDMWRNDHPEWPLEPVPADMVMASGSGLDPHITLANARYQLKYRVAAAQATKLVKDRVNEQLKAQDRDPPADAARKKLEEQASKELASRFGKPAEERVREILEGLLNDAKAAPLGGLVGGDMVNVLELNVGMTQHMEKLAQDTR
jgi:K+-transporting ATPase ATPase C chain